MRRTSCYNTGLTDPEYGCAAWLVSCLLKENPGPSHFSIPRFMLAASHRRLRLIIISMSIMPVFKADREEEDRPRAGRFFFFSTYSYNQSDTWICEIKQSYKVGVSGAALMTDEERRNHFCSQMKCKELHGQTLSFTAPHFKCCFLSFHWNLLAFLGTLLHTRSQVRSFFFTFIFFAEVKYLPSPSSTRN